MKASTATAWIAALFLASSVFSHTVALRLVLLAAGIVTASIAVAKEKDLSALPPVWIPFVLWGAWALASLAWSIEPERTLKEWRNEVFYTAAALGICYVGAQARQAERILLPVLGAASMIVCGVALYNFSRGIGPYQQGFHGGPGDHSSALLTLMPCALVMAWHAARTSRPRLVWVACGLAALFVVSAYTTLNRTIWLGFIVQLALVSAMILRRALSLSARSKRIAALVSLAALASSLAVLGSVQSERERMRIAHPMERDSRLALWPEILERAGERPMTGFGFGRGLLRDELRAELGAVDVDLWHAHNLFLDALVQVGAPGVLLLVVLLGVLAYRAWLMAGSPDDAAAACGIALLAVVAGMVVRNMTDSLLVRQNALLFWGLAGALLAMGRRWPVSR